MYDAGTSGRVVFYEARYYDPVLGRFISPDTIVPDPLNPQSLNRYAYALNNPILYTDPSGHWFGIDDLFVAVAGAIVGGITAAVTGQDIFLGVVSGAAAAWVGYNTGGAAWGFSGGDFVIAGAIGGASGAGAATAIYALAGYPVDPAQSILAGAAAGIAGGLAGSYCGVCGIPAGAATGAAVTGGDPGQAALVSLIAVGVAVGYEAYDILDNQAQTPGPCPNGACLASSDSLPTLSEGTYQALDNAGNILIAVDILNGPTPDVGIIGAILKGTARAFRPVTFALKGKEAAKAAAKLGFKRVKERLAFAKGQPVFKKGQRYITPDVGTKAGTSHKGGVWKVYGKKGGKFQREGTFNKDLTIKLGD